MTQEQATQSIDSIDDSVSLSVFVQSRVLKMLKQVHRETGADRREVAAALGGQRRA